MEQRKYNTDVNNPVRARAPARACVCVCVCVYVELPVGNDVFVLMLIDTEIAGNYLDDTTVKRKCTL
jgi:hypothetical protein